MDEVIDTLAPLLAEQRQRWAERCHAHGLSVIGFHAIALLELHGRVPMSRLADDLNVALPNATGIVARLAERGVVERTDDPTDRRVVLVGLTEAGHALMAEIESARRDRLRRLLEAMPPEARLRLAQSVHDLREAARTIASTSAETE